MDIFLSETGNGGDLVMKGNDFHIIYGIENQPYLALFGGNIEASTSNIKPEKSLDYWGNNYFYFSQITAQLNSLTERSYNDIPLSSFGRIQIENAIKKDLSYLNKLNVTFDVAVKIVSDDRIDTIINLVQGENKSVVIISHKKKADGDFFIYDFNNDFNV